MSQESNIIYHLHNKGGITPIEALELYGCFRLGARIHELKREGYDIETLMVENNGKRFAKYVLKDKNEKI
jgi:hypothetical protein